MGETEPIPRVGRSGTVEPRSGHRTVGWQRRLLHTTGLVIVAVLAGLVWWLVRHEATVAVGTPRPEPTQNPLTNGAFDYTVAAGPVTANDCARHSYGEIHEWFAEHSCERVSRALYTTTTNGARVLVSVSVVTMPTAADAARLYELAYTDGTGNVSDLVRDGATTIPNAPDVAEGQYKSKLTGARLTIVEANSFGGHSAKALLTRIAADARRLSAALE